METTKTVEDINKRRDKVQKEAIVAWASSKPYKYRGLLAMATGVGKSKIAVDISRMLTKSLPSASIVLAVPTTKLRDKNWPDEFIKWGQEELWDNNVERYCYKSLNNVKNQEIQLLILDEAHNLTDLSAEVFKNNIIRKVLCLTATPPNKDGSDADRAKADLFKKLEIPTVFDYPLDEAVEEGLVAPYTMDVIECYLDDVDKYVKAGTKDKPFYQTEYAAYNYIDRIAKQMMYARNPAAKWKIMARARLVNSLKSKTEVGIQLLDTIIPNDKRYLIFFGSIKQAEDVMGDRVYHSKTDDKALMAFINGDIDRLGVIEALNEGHNIPNLDGILVFKFDSQKRKMTQRIGRALRARPGHRARVFVLVTLGTVDENWFKKATEDLDDSVITYHHSKNLDKFIY